MSGLLHSHRALLLAHPRRERALLRALPRHLGVADARGDWAFATLPPLLALPEFLGHTGDEALQAHHFACFWGLATDRVADGQATGDLTEVIALHRAAWQRALSSLITPSRAAALVERADALQRRGFALERHLFAQRRCTPRDYTRCLALRTAWFSATSLQLVPRARRRATERGLQQLMLSLQLIDDAVDAPDDTRARGASWPTLLRVTPAEFHAAAVSVAQRAAKTLLGARHASLAAWCRQRAAAVSRAFSVPLPDAGGPPAPAVRSASRVATISAASATAVRSTTRVATSGGISAPAVRSASRVTISAASATAVRSSRGATISAASAPAVRSASGITTLPSAPAVRSTSGTFLRGERVALRQYW